MAIKIMIVVIILAGAGLFFVNGPDGSPILTLGDLKPEIVDDLEKQTRGPTKVYKWKDENGVWQFSNQPVDGSGVEVMELDGDINIMPSVSVPRAASAPAVSTSSSLPDNMSPANIEQAMESVKALEDAMNQRDKQAKELLNR